METSHSFPSNSQRIATQLPFSPSPSGPSFVAQRLQSQNKPRSGSTSTSATPHTRSGSVISSRSRAQNPIVSGELFTPPLPVPLFNPRPPNSPSHISGIPPSAAFFHPLRPGQNSPTPPPFGRPSSPGSIVSSEAHGTIPVHLGPFTRQDTRDTEYSGSVNISSAEDLTNALGSPHKSTKQSRDPLLPIGRARRSTTTSRPSISVTGPYGRSETNVSAGGRMRGSFEKLFKRGLSFEAGRKPVQGSPSSVLDPTSIDPAANCISRSRQTSPITPSHNGHMTFDLTARDDEFAPTSPIGPFKRNAGSARASSTSLQNLAFNPIPPDMCPRLAETPKVDPETGKIFHKWQLHPSRNRFFLGGRLLTGGDSPWAFIASLTIIFAITGIWFGTTCVWWWLNESPAVAAVGVYMCLLTISSMAATAFRDPGILPRNLDPDPPTASTETDGTDRIPLPRDLKVRAGVVRVKYCPTCRTYRPPRSSHCKMCDNCVDGCDHHCQWVNNCIGRRNYTSFFTFLLSAVLTLILVICTTAIHLWLLTTSRFGLNFRQALATSQGVGSAVAFSLSILIVWPVSALLVYHARLLLLNVTTIEQIRMQAHKSLVSGPAPPNAFSHGSWYKNLLYVLCRPPGYSWLDFPAVATEDKREINPGMVDNWQADTTAAMEEGRSAPRKY